MSSVVIHIGPPKTGTTSIQKFLFSHKKELESLGYVYPNQVNHQDIFNFFKNQGSEVPAVLSEALNLVFSSGSNLLISCEFLSSFSDEEFINMRNFFKTKGFQNISVCLFVRDILSITFSSRQELLKKGFIFDQDELKGLSMRYSVLLSRLERVFGGSNVTFSLFKESLEFDAVGSFLSLNKIALSQQVSLSANKSMSFEQSCLLNMLNSYSIPFDLKKLRKKFALIQYSQFGGWEKERKLLTKLAKEENDWLKRNYNISPMEQNLEFCWYKFSDYYKTVNELTKIGLLPDYLDLSGLSQPWSNR